MKQRDLARQVSTLGFSPKPAVRWLVPTELVRTAVQALVAQMFADYADKRELQAVLPQGTLALAGAEAPGELWLDYVADLGDGFDATYTVATLLASPSLALSDGLVLPRGELLVMGGDEVYPVASSIGYDDRTTGPYSAAFPAGTGEATLLALPGNHDWYDGLTAFLRTFTHRRPIGAWSTIQSRSYFAVRLRPGWWLVGLDTQLGEYIDQPQLDYFREHLTAHLDEGDAVILCCASPTWERVEKQPDAFDTLHFFERTVLRSRIVDGVPVDTGARVRLWISGDHHHYVRYEVDDGDSDAHDPTSAQFVTCGLGGAYLMGTDDAPATVTLPSAESRMRSKDPDSTRFRRAPTVYPDAPTGRRLAWKIANPFGPFWLPTRNSSFGLTVGAIQLVLVVFVMWVLSVSRGDGLLETVRGATPAGALAISFFALWLPLLLVTANLFVVSLRRGRWHPAHITALVAVACQLVVASVLVQVLVVVPWRVPDAVLLVLGVVVVAVAGSVAGSEVFALHVLLARPGPFANLRMSGLAHEHGKGFLRLHLTDTGELHLYPILVDRICTEWTLDTSRGDRVTPAPLNGLPPVRLLEGPVVITQRGRGV